jgi:hypothetical protein
MNSFLSHIPLFCSVGKQEIFEVGVVKRSPHRKKFPTWVEKSEWDSARVEKIE